MDDTHFVIVMMITILLAAMSASLLLKKQPLFKFKSSQNSYKLPPSPFTLPIIGNFLSLRKSLFDVEPLLRSLFLKHGPIVALPVGGGGGGATAGTSIFISSHSLAYQTLIQDGAVFAGRPKDFNIGRININSATYGPAWRRLRRNLASEMLHPSRLKSHAGSRRRVLRILVDDLLLSSSSSSSGAAVVRVADHVQYAMFCLLCLMCFGGELEEKTVRDVEATQRRVVLSIPGFQRLKPWGILAGLLFRKRLSGFMKALKANDDVLIPLIRSRNKKAKTTPNHTNNNTNGECNTSSNYKTPTPYVDTLLGLELPEGKRGLTEEEVVSLCSEFLTAGTDTTLTAIEWIMANLVKYPHVQDKLFSEIKEVIIKHREEEEEEEEVEEVEEEDTQKMPYLKAVVLEGLRRHPPGHFLLPHTVTEDVFIDGYVLPKNATVNFAVVEMGRDPNVWEDPMAFKPERFLCSNNNSENNVQFDLTGSKEIKMMPFGVGRRMCPAHGMAVLHLEYFVANLVWKFEWKAAGEVDLSEKEEFTVVMENPLQVHLIPRRPNKTRDQTKV